MCPTRVSADRDIILQSCIMVTLVRRIIRSYGTEICGKIAYS